MLVLSFVALFSYLESLRKLESDYRNNLRKLQGDDQEVDDLYRSLCFNLFTGGFNLHSCFCCWFESSIKLSPEPVVEPEISNESIKFWGKNIGELFLDRLL